MWYIKTNLTQFFLKTKTYFYFFQMLNWNSQNFLDHYYLFKLVEFTWIKINTIPIVKIKLKVMWAFLSGRRRWWVSACYYWIVFFIPGDYYRQRWWIGGQEVVIWSKRCIIWYLVPCQEMHHPSRLCVEGFSTKTTYKRQPCYKRYCYVSISLTCGGFWRRIVYSTSVILCPCFEKVWTRLLKLFGISCAVHKNLEARAYQFFGLSHMGKEVCSKLDTI